MYQIFKRLSENERGGIVFWMLMMPFIAAGLAMIMYTGYAFAIKATARSKLENALLSAVVLSKPTLTNINGTAAQPYFNEYLEKNLQLNPDLTPQPDSPAIGPVQILYYEAINTTTPITDPSGITTDTIDKPSLEAEIQFPVEGGFTVRVFSRVSVAT